MMQYAAHSVVTRPYRLSLVEWALVGLSAVALGVALVAWRRRGRERASEARRELALVAQAFVLYNVATLATWTLRYGALYPVRFLI